MQILVGGLPGFKPVAQCTTRGRAQVRQLKVLSSPENMCSSIGRCNIQEFLVLISLISH